MNVFVNDRTMLMLMKTNPIRPKECIRIIDMIRWGKPSHWECNICTDLAHNEVVMFYIGMLEKEGLTTKLLSISE